MRKGVLYPPPSHDWVDSVVRRRKEGWVGCKGKQWMWWLMGYIMGEGKGLDKNIRGLWQVDLMAEK